MIVAVALGLLALIAGVQLLRWFAHADVKAVKNTLRWIAIGVLALGVLFLLVTGRMGAALALSGALLAWAWRIMNMIHIGRQFGGMFRTFGFGRSGAKQTSAVESRYLSMQLDHDTGAMDGDVREGRFAGRRLSRLTREDLNGLLQEIEGDRDSVSLLEAYLDRTHPDWRDQTQSHGSASPPTSTMTVDEAYRILGLETGADEAAIKAAYRRLMAQLHPDHGGSDYLAAKVNQAKDFLVKSKARS